MGMVIVENDETLYGTFETHAEAYKWAEDNLSGPRKIRTLVDRAEAEPPRLEVGDVVRIKDRHHRVGIIVYVPGGSEGVVTRDGNDSVSVMFHAPHDDGSYPKHDWTRQSVSRRDLIKVRP